MRTWLTSALAVCLASPSLAAEPPFPIPTELYTRDVVFGPGGLLLNVLKGLDDKQECTSVDLSSTTRGSAERTGARIISEAYITTRNGGLGYYFWVAEKSGVHTIFAASYIMKNCAVTETRRDQQYFTDENRYRTAGAAYNKLLRAGLPPN